MSLHRGHGEVVEVETSHAQPRSDAQKASNIELLEIPCNDSSRQSNSAVATANLKRSTLQKELYVKFWTRVVSLFVNWWMGELLAILLSIIALLAIVVILRRYDDHPPPALPYNVPLNLIVATLATVSKSSLLLAMASAIGQFKWLWMSSKQRRLQDLQVFDEATRGPLGASKLLASRRALSWASLGAIVTILCLIFDPFVQGLISVPQRVVYKDNPAAILSRMINYPQLPETGYWNNIYPLMNTLSDAAFNPNPLPETQPHCPSGNCTWPPFTSLGFCSKCQDITQPLRASSKYVDTNNNNTCPDDDTSQCEPNYRNYTYQVGGLSPNGDSGLSTIARVSYEFLVNPNFEYVPGFLVKPIEWTGTTAFNFTDGTSIPIVALVALLRTSTKISTAGDVLAADLCALSFYAHRRKVSVSLNQPSSSTLQTVYGNEVIYEDHSSENHTKWVSFTGNDLKITFPSPINKTDYLDESVTLWEAQLSLTIQSIEGNLSTSPNGGGHAPTATSNIVAAFNASSNISLTMNNIATSITNYYRDSVNDTVAGGQASETESYIHVNWPWITLPAFLVAMGTVFLMLAIFETRRRGARIWKTSELAVLFLFHGLEESSDGERESNTFSYRSSEMEHVAAGIRVKMARTSTGGWTLRRERSPPIKSA